MKRYLIFGYDGYYPQGGMWDFQFSVDGIEDIVVHSGYGTLKFFDFIDVYDTKEFVLYEYDWKTTELTKVEELEEWK